MKLYTIEGGEHSSNRFPSLTTSNIASFTVRFNLTAKYTLNFGDQGDINKLFGLSDSWCLHHRHSARIGWRWNLLTNKVEILGYCYVNGKRVTQSITEVDIDKPIQMNIVITKYKYVFSVHDTIRYIPRRLQSGINGLKYKLFPYFGGNQAAPHTITIEMEDRTDG